MTVTNLLSKLRHEGPRGVAQRAARRAYLRLGAESLEDSLLPGDLADSSDLALRPGRVSPEGLPLHVGWVCTPPAPGSGGHTTMFRMVSALEQAGHRCTVLLYDRHHGITHEAERIVREGWPQVRAAVRSVDSGFAGLDACVATGWESAHVMARHGSDQPMHRFYFVQDFEPWFYPRGSRYEMAADSYRFGYTTIALGHTVRDQLRDELRVASEFVPFACDRDVYRLERSGPRSGVVFYVKHDVPRRGALHGLAALTELHRRRPEQEIHLFGSRPVDLPFPAVQHGRMSPTALSALYNQCAAGLALSFTNITLVADEMLAAGCLPVANEFPGARENLPHPDVVWTNATPASLADGLCAALERAEDPGLPARLAAGGRAETWDDTGRHVVAIVEGTVRGTRVPRQADMYPEEAR